MATRGTGPGGGRNGASGARGESGRASRRSPAPAANRTKAAAKPVGRAAGSSPKASHKASPKAAPKASAKTGPKARTKARGAAGRPDWAVSGNRGARAAMGGAAPPRLGRRAIVGGTLLFAVGLGFGLHLRRDPAPAVAPPDPVSAPLPPRRPPPGTVTMADVPAAEAVRIDLPMAEGATPEVLAAPARPARVTVPDRAVLASLPPEPVPAPPRPRPVLAAAAPTPGRTPSPDPALALAPARVPAAPRAPVWLANARNVAHPGRRPMVAVVIDDLGLDRDRTARVSALPGPLTLSFMAYAQDLPAQAAAGRAFGHELMLHMPMQPRGADIDPGPGALLVGLSPGEIRRRLERGLAAFSGYVGLNNHMGSRFTADDSGMGVVMDVARRRELLFLDSRTTGASVAPGLAAAARVPFLERTVFLDHDPGRAAVERQLAELERLAVRHGHAVAIGHPRDATVAALSAWIEPVRGRGLALVPASAVARFAHAV